MVNSLLGVIPTIIVGGVAIKVVEHMFPKKKGRKKPVKLGFGNFRNVGF